MGRTVVALSGPVASGKSTLASSLVRDFGAVHLRTHDLLQARARHAGLGDLADRRALQSYGEELDRRTNGRWVAEDLGPVVAQLPDRAIVIVDAIRISEQLQALHEAFGRRITHIHLTAETSDLADRYTHRAPKFTELPDYELVRADPTEAAVPNLAPNADLLLDTSSMDPEAGVLLAAARLGLLAHTDEPLVDVVIGGQFGSEGKGNICFYLAPEYDVLVRIGGPNAGHMVPTQPPYRHRHLPSGTLSNETAQLIIGPGAVLNLEILFSEISDCRVEVSRLAIDPQAMIIEEADIAAESTLESISSTRQGVGAASARRINNRGTYATGSLRLARDVPELRPYTSVSTGLVLERAFRENKRVLLEGTQGTGLSLFHGSYPHVTSRDTTAAGCLSEAGIAANRVRRILMVTRSWPIRVGGTSGPMRDETTLDDVASQAGLPAQDLTDREVGSVSGRPRRIAGFDWEQFRRSVELNGPTDIVLTFADYIDAANRGAHRFDQLTPETIRFIDDLEQVAGCRVTLVATDFDRRGVVDRRPWRGHISEPGTDNEVF